MITVLVKLAISNCRRGTVVLCLLLGTATCISAAFAVLPGATTTYDVSASRDDSSYFHGKEQGQGQ
jgi:hypothetical protein